MMAEERAARRPMGGRCLLILLAAGFCGLVFNLAMPQGIGFLPKEVSDPKWEPVSLSGARALWEEGSLFVDAREPNDYRAGRVQKAVNLYPTGFALIFPLLKEQLASAGRVVVYGRSRGYFPAAFVAQKLKENGIGKVMVLDTSFDNWQKAGYPVTRPRRRSAK